MQFQALFPLAFLLLAVGAGNVSLEESHAAPHHHHKSSRHSGHRHHHKKAQRPSLPFTGLADDQDHATDAAAVNFFEAGQIEEPVAETEESKTGAWEVQRPGSESTTEKKEAKEQTDTGKEETESTAEEPAIETGKEEPQAAEEGAATESQAAEVEEEAASEQDEQDVDDGTPDQKASSAPVDAPFADAPDLPFSDLEPFGRENTGQELTEASIRQSNDMVDQIEKAEEAEEQRSVFRALTRLRGAALTAFDGIARSHQNNIVEYAQNNQYREVHPVKHLAEEEADVEKWAFPLNAD